MMAGTTILSVITGLNHFSPRVEASTLANRTRQRNHLLLRLKGAMRFARHLGLTSHVLNYTYVIVQVESDQLNGKQATLKLRK
jgi:hypothetical protein